GVAVRGWVVPSSQLGACGAGGPAHAAGARWAGTFAFDPRLHPADIRQPSLVRPGGVHVAANHVHELRAELRITGHGPCLGQRLELPRLSPAFVVLLVGTQRAGQWAIAPFGPKPQVNLERLALRCDL